MMTDTNGRSHTEDPTQVLQASIDIAQGGNGHQAPAQAPPPAETHGIIEQPGAILSPSQANTYLDCAARWYFKHLLRLPEPLNSNLAVGRVVDDTISAYLRVKTKERRELSADDVRDTLNLAWADQEAELSLQDGESPGELRDLCARLVTSYITEMAPRVEPAIIDGEPAIQFPVQGKIAGVDVRGCIDILTEEGTVIDLKTKTDKPHDVAANHMLQVTTYDLICPNSRGKAEIHYVVKGRAATTKAKTVPFTRDIGPAEVLYAESIYPMVQEAMRDGLYLPQRAARICSRKYCPFWQACEKEFGGRVPE